MNRTSRLPFVLSCLIGISIILGSAARSWSQDVRFGSKKFTESVILGELLTHLARDVGATVEHRKELGGTRVLWGALLNGDIDAYAEYSGTIQQELFAGQGIETEDQMRAVLEAQGIRMAAPLGFNNTYAIGMREADAERLGIHTISDMKNHPDLILGFGNEFMDRGDGWPALKARYELEHKDVRGLDHALAYRGLESGSIQVMDMYSTDAEIAYYGLRTLRDDLLHFPTYNASFIYRADLEGRFPKVVGAIHELSGLIAEDQMIAMNARVKLDKVSDSQVAADFLASAPNHSTCARPAISLSGLRRLESKYS